MKAKEITPSSLIKSESEEDKAKNDVLNYLGGKNSEALKEIIQHHVKEDKFKENSTHIFQHIQKYQNVKKLSFSESCKKFAQEKLKYNYIRRMAKALLPCALYFTATALLLTGFGIVPAIAISIFATGISGLAESREKRNVASIGHAQEHLVKAQMNAIKETYDKFKNDLKDNQKEEIDKILGLKVKSKIFYKLKNSNLGSTIARGFSYVSGPFISGGKTIYSTLKGLSQTAVFNVVAGLIAPFMPFINIGISFTSAKLRHRYINKKLDKFEQIVELLFDPKNYKEAEKPDFDKLKSIFRKNFKSNHHEEPDDQANKKSSFKKRFLKGDKNTNITKAISLPNWLGNKIRHHMPNFMKKFKTEDLTKPPANFDNDNEKISYSINITKDEKEEQSENNNEEQKDNTEKSATPKSSVKIDDEFFDTYILDDNPKSEESYKE